MRSANTERGAKIIEFVILIMVVAVVILFADKKMRATIFSKNPPLVKIAGSVASEWHNIFSGDDYSIPEQVTSDQLADRLAYVLIEGAYEDAEIDALIGAIKERAQYVVTGTVSAVNIAENRRDYDAEGDVVLVLDVESVERGEYPYEVMEVMVGYYANSLPSAVYPLHVKTRYKQGDRVRVYVDEQREIGYVSMGGFFTVDAR